LLLLPADAIRILVRLRSQPGRLDRQQSGRYVWTYAVPPTGSVPVGCGMAAPMFSASATVPLDERTVGVLAHMEGGVGVCQAGYTLMCAGREVYLLDLDGRVVSGTLAGTSSRPTSCHRATCCETAPRTRSRSHSGLVGPRATSKR
jgi:hypothetical protein